MSAYWKSEHTVELIADGVLYLFNPLSGALDRITDDKIREQWVDARQGLCRSEDVLGMFMKRGYIYHNKEEEAQLVKKLQALEYQVTSKTLRCHIIFTYDCNLRCTYCYEEGIPRTQDVVTEEMLETMLAVIEQLRVDEAHEKIQVILFGGEPLLWHEEQVKRVQTVLDRATKQGWELEIVTNGVDLIHYVPLLREHVISEIQVTIDGPKEIHDLRRISPYGKGTFDRITASVDASLQSGLPIVVRVNADDQNVASLPQLQRFFDSKRWTSEPMFGSYLGLTFDLFGHHRHCSSAPVMLEKVLGMRKRYPSIKGISLEAWEPLQFLLYPFMMGETRLPKFSFCGAQCSDWCFDLYGDVYFCADGVGREQFKVGRFYPSLDLDPERVAYWRPYDVQKADGCRTCKVRLCCGGGCQFQKAIKTGSLTRPHCTDPVLPLLNVTLKYLHRTPEVFRWPAKEKGEIGSSNEA